MERKIGEIFEYNGEWCQCVEGNGCKNCTFEGRKCYLEGGTDDPIGECCYDRRRDNKDVIFKKLEKVGEPYVKRVSDCTFSTFQRYRVYNSVILPKEPYIYCNFIDSTIEIEVKQTKEDMEEKKLNLKPFDLQKAREGKPVCTRDGRKARIICFDRIDAKPILALIPSTDGKGEVVFDYFVSGKRIANALESDLDLMMLPEKKERWVNVYKGGLLDTKSYPTKKEAFDKAFPRDYVATVKIQWEE